MRGEGALRALSLVSATCGFALAFSGLALPLSLAGRLAAGIMTTAVAILSAVRGWDYFEGLLDFPDRWRDPDLC